MSNPFGMTDEEVRKQNEYISAQIRAGVDEIREEDEPPIVNGAYALCTVHASTDCAQPLSTRAAVKFDGQNDNPRIECPACYTALSS